ncbi:MAG TPA: LamG domain-containing protein, partial [Armatimonadota bacterium]|nr:LamG domain-containing protein [Armatimonadota bacterium]
MRHAFMAITVLLLATSAMCQTDPPEPWQQPYTGADAAGPDVIGLWQFDAGAEGEDSSGNGHALVLRGDSGYVAEGKFGGGLESFPASTEHDVAQGAVAQDHDALSPAGAFTIEAWFKPRPEMYDQARAVIIDKKYYYYANDAPTANNDYCLYLSRAGENRVRVIAFLGYGDDSAQYTSSDVDVLPDEWYHVAFTYDGAGTGRFFLNGTRIGKTTHEGRGPVSPGVYGFAIGDRHGSTHVGFPGFIDQVRISSGVVPFFTGSLEIEAEPGARCAFVRMEEDISIPIIITNDAGKALTDVEAVICLSGVDDGELLISLPDLDVGGSYAIPVPIDTAMRPDSYGWDVDVSATGEDRDYAVEGTIPFHIVPRPLPNQMPVLMWGGGDFETLKEIGFTHKLVHLVDYGKVWEAGEPTEAMAAGQVDQYAKQLDEHLVNGVGGAVYVYPGRWLARNEKLLEEYVRVDRNGEPYDKDNICGNFEAAQEFAYNVGASVANSYGDFPGLQSSLIHSEIRDGTSLCFHDHDREAFREFAGYDIPTQAASK